jgi:uncharacterized protein (TIGR02453 family)
MPTHFQPAALRFLKALKKNNDRTWFAERKPVYEREVLQPFLAFADEVNEALADFAPDCVKPARKALFRIYRDTRFSNDKRPYKTHAGAWWSPASLAKTSGAGFYMHLAGDEVVVAAGAFMPQPEQLLLIRRHVQQHHAAMRTLLGGKGLRKLLPDLDSKPLTRMPKGFAADDPAADLLLFRQWGLSTTLPAELATTPRLLPEVVKRFRAAAPWVELLNAPLLEKKQSARKTFF